MQIEYTLGGASAVNLALFPNFPVSDDQANAFLTDPYYGLNNTNNYVRWDALSYNSTS